LLFTVVAFAVAACVFLAGPRQADTLRAALSVRTSDGHPLFSSVQVLCRGFFVSKGQLFLSWPASVSEHQHMQRACMQEHMICTM